jgi:hypothetical protein
MCLKIARSEQHRFTLSDVLAKTFYLNSKILTTDTLGSWRFMWELINDLTLQKSE